MGASFGIVDADDRDNAEIERLKSLHIFTLPVSEIESLFALPKVFLALADILHCSTPEERLKNLTSAIIKIARADLEAASCRYVTRVIDNKLKNVEVSMKTIEDLETAFTEEVKNIIPRSIYNDFKSRLETNLDSANLEGILRMYDNKGIAGTVANHLGLAGKKEFFDKISRVMHHESGNALRKELTAVLPEIAV
ncbi:hypothetical protein KH5H1_04800 [Corallococcus caeni]|nr:hypothetical protein KH5H1_04800 [Corallococcus sp. KH5-1]